MCKKFIRHYINYIYCIISKSCANKKNKKLNKDI